MESSHLDTAAKYINNLLLARGLLRDGAPIDFIGLANGRPKDGKDSITVTAQIMNLVHDMILRKDRDQEQQEALAITLRNLRIEAAKHHAEVESLTDRNKALARENAESQKSIRAVMTSASSAERAAKALREELARAKTTLTQVRTQCANDVRKRDVQIHKLKTHITQAAQRGNRTSAAGKAMTINHGRDVASATSDRHDSVPSLEDTDYSLKQETTEFLTQLSQNLSNENDALIGVIRATLDTLKELQGLPHNQSLTTFDTDGSDMNSNVPLKDPLVQTPSSFNELSDELEMVLHTLRDLLTSPAFAPIEEVEVREEEIHRLRDAWVKMEAKWLEAVALMQGWQQRLTNGGHVIGIEELKVGLNLGEGLEEIKQAANIQSPLSVRSQRDASASASPVAQRREEFDELGDLDGDEMGDVVEDLNDNLFKLDVRTTQDDKLKEVNGNSRIPKRQSRRVGFYNSHTTQENIDVHDQIASADEKRASGKVARGYMQSTSSSRSSTRDKPTRPATRSETKAKVDETGNTSKLLDDTTRHPNLSSASVVPELSVKEKLKHAESEARRVSSTFDLSLGHADDHEADEAADAEDGVGQQQIEVEALDAHATARSPTKRTRMSGKPRRRKSTLSPEELEQLMLG